MTNKDHLPQPTHPDANLPISEEIDRALADYLPGIDFILVTPSQMANCMVAQRLAPDTTHKMLKWDNRKNTYRLHLL